MNGPGILRMKRSHNEANENKLDENIEISSKKSRNSKILPFLWFGVYQII